VGSHLVLNYPQGKATAYIILFSRNIRIMTWFFPIEKTLMLD
jgi:hypothetical protein